jgi:hypothetical protein
MYNETDVVLDPSIRPRQVRNPSTRGQRLRPLYVTSQRVTEPAVASLPLTRRTDEVGLRHGFSYPFDLRLGSCTKSMQIAENNGPQAITMKAL